MANRFTVDRLWSFYKGLSIVRAHILMSSTTPVLQTWVPPSLNSSTAGAYATASSTANPQGGIGTAAQGSEGVKSVTRTATGLWTVVLQDNYTRLLGVRVHQALAGGLSTILAVGVNSTLTNLAAAGGAAVGVALLTAGSGGATPVAADPGDTTFVTLTFTLQNSTAL